MSTSAFLPGVPVEHVLARLASAGGNEVESGKLASPESSAALAVNCFGWFIPRPEMLPMLPGLEAAGIPEFVDVEFCARFPWAGGRHPWLDAVVITPTALMGIESKRFEPFRDRKTVSLSQAYDRAVWGDDMKHYEAMRDRLREGEETFVHLDAVQLVKHAFGLVTEARRRGRSPALLYIFAEPAARNGRPISPDETELHRRELAHFAGQVAGDEVAFHYIAYQEWLDTWGGCEPAVSAHASALEERFCP